MESKRDGSREWARRFFAVTVFVDDLARERQWYTDVFGMPVVDESPDSCTFRFPGEVFINLNTLAAAADHIEPAPLPTAGMPSRMMLSLEVDDVDVVVERLVSIGVKPVNGPVDRPWGSRDVTIADQSNNYWELFSKAAAG